MHPDASIAEVLPRVYRRVLDAVETLQRGGGRAEATRLRRTAVAVYSGAWDAKSHRRLEEIATRAELAAREQERRNGLRAA
jgi:uncharacterized protein YeaC (DUF1315 family)